MGDLTPQQRSDLRTVVITAVDKAVKAAKDAARAATEASLYPGDARTVLSPLDGTPIARISKTRPQKSDAVVTDRAAVDAWIAARYPEKQCSRWEITGPMADVLAALRKHAPHLVAEVTSVPDWAVNELCIKSAAAGAPVGYGGETNVDAPTGIEVRPPAGQVRVVLDANAKSAIEDLWRAGVVGMDGEVRQIEEAR